jgi:hypothetical protein
MERVKVVEIKEDKLFKFSDFLVEYQILGNTKSKAFILTKKHKDDFFEIRFLECTYKSINEGDTFRVMSNPIK